MKILNGMFFPDGVGAFDLLPVERPWLLPAACRPGSEKFNPALQACWHLLVAADNRAWARPAGSSSFLIKPKLFVT
ncbi:hypothetical protein [Halomonas sp. AOP43-D1-4]|uniref:hypothetical protein n=1 Tax=Halomonas sp. AOP43-D1-4 TaxID=3457658 RepID=UPI004034B815